MASKLAAGSGWSFFLCEGRGGGHKLDKDVGSLSGWPILPATSGALCYTRLRETMVVGPMRQRHAASSILYKHIICLLRGWTGDLTPGRMLHFFSAFTHRVRTYGYSGGSPLPSSVPTRGHDRQLVAAPRLKRGPYLTRGGCEGCKLRVRCCKTERIQSPRLSGSNRQVWTFFSFSPPPWPCAEQSVGRETEREGARMTTANNSLYIDTKPCGSPSTHHSMLYFVVAPRGTHAEHRVPGRPPSRGAPPGMHRQA